MSLNSGQKNNDESSTVADAVFNVKQMFPNQRADLLQCEWHAFLESFEAKLDSQFAKTSVKFCLLRACAQFAGRWSFAGRMGWRVVAVAMKGFKKTVRRRQSTYLACRFVGIWEFNTSILKCFLISCNTQARVFEDAFTKR